jgi:hypothetical protein
VANNPSANYSQTIMIKEIKKHKDNIRNALKMHGKKVKTKLTSTIKNARGTGHKYANLPNRSSAPGEIPVSQSGKLERSFGYRARVNELMIYNNARSAGGAPYALFLNEGTRKMKPRQYFDNTIDSMNMMLYSDLQNIVY